MVVFLVTIAAHSFVCSRFNLLPRDGFSTAWKLKIGNREYVISMDSHARETRRPYSRGKDDDKPAATMVRAALRASRTTRCPLTPSTRVRSTNRRVHLLVVYVHSAGSGNSPTKRAGDGGPWRGGVNEGVRRRRRDCFTCCFGVNTDTPKHNLMMRASSFVRRLSEESGLRKRRSDESVSTKTPSKS